MYIERQLGLLVQQLRPLQEDVKDGAVLSLNIDSKQPQKIMKNSNLSKILSSIDWESTTTIQQEPFV